MRSAGSRVSTDAAEKEVECSQPAFHSATPWNVKSLTGNKGVHIQTVCTQAAGRRASVSFVVFNEKSPTNLGGEGEAQPAQLPQPRQHRIRPHEQRWSHCEQIPFHRLAAHCTGIQLEARQLVRRPADGCGDLQGTMCTHLLEETCTRGANDATADS